MLDPYKILMTRSLWDQFPIFGQALGIGHPRLTRPSRAQATWRIYAARKFRPTVPVRPDWIERRSTEPRYLAREHGMFTWGKG